MSAICPASVAILALNVNGLSFGAAGKGKELPDRSIDVQLGCEFILKGRDSRQSNLRVLEWSGSSDLCGSCPFCDLVVDGLRRASVDEMHAKARAVSGPLGEEDTRFLDLRIVLKKLGYRNDPSSWLNGQKMESMRRIHLLVIRAAATFSKDLDPGIDPQAINMDIALELFGDEKDYVPAVFGIHRRPLETSVLSECNVEKIKSWIKDCEDCHAKCREDMVAEFIPTRLLEVGDPAFEDDLRLIECSDVKTQLRESKHPNYMALSYCWGDPGHSLTTTSETLPARLLRISIDSIPQAFRDAVKLSRTLGIRYIWIDSLCIIQDDKQDWQFESSRMAEIFSNAHLTVIAAQGDSCSDSFLQRNPKILSCSVPVLSRDSPTCHFNLRHRRRHWGTDKMTEIRDGRWITRGWTFQEERLARRVLMFGERKFFFDCRTMERVEDTHLCKTRPDWVETIRDKPFNIEAPAYGQADSSHHNFNSRTPYDHWQTLCSQYSRRVLTYSTDMLPAISGIAKKTSRRIHSDYLAGLWRANLFHDLFWHSVSNAMRPKEYRAPSWSWASVDGHINWPTWRYCGVGSCHEYCSIISAQTSTTSLDPFGAVTSGHLTVLGKIIKVTVAFREDIDPTTSQVPWTLYSKGRGFATARPDVAPEFMGVDGELECYALLVARCRIKKGQAPVSRGLLLEKAGKGVEEYRRIGTFRVILSTTAEADEDRLLAWEGMAAETVVII